MAGENEAGLDAGALVAKDPPLCRAVQIIEAAAARKGSVLITGPTGVGKELLARLVHRRSGRRGGFVAVNCAAFNAGLVESALFGHVRGAFTGAVAPARGAFVEAHGGTLFLDEVGELEISIQAKLLRALEEGVVRPLGGARASSVDVRVVSATNRELRREADAGRFRADLFFRLTTFLIEVPPLQARPGDLAALIDGLWAEHDRGSLVTLTAEARAVLTGYAWPGNVRELRNVVERVLTLARAGELGPEELLRVVPELSGRGPDPGTEETLAALEERRIIEALCKRSGARQQAAGDLGIHRTTLWRRLKRMRDDGAKAT